MYNGSIITTIHQEYALMEYLVWRDKFGNRRSVADVDVATEKRGV